MKAERLLERRTWDSRAFRFTGIPPEECRSTLVTLNDTDATLFSHNRKASVMLQVRRRRAEENHGHERLHRSS